MSQDPARAEKQAATAARKAVNRVAWAVRRR
jgi:hypothetical protein